MQRYRNNINNNNSNDNNNKEYEILVTLPATFENKVFIAQGILRQSLTRINEKHAISGQISGWTLPLP